MYPLSEKHIWRNPLPIFGSGFFYGWKAGRSPSTTRGFQVIFSVTLEFPILVMGPGSAGQEIFSKIIAEIFGGIKQYDYLCGVTKTKEIMELKELFTSYCKNLDKRYCDHDYQYGYYKSVVMPLDIQETIGRMLFSYKKDLDYYGIKAGDYKTVQCFACIFWMTIRGFMSASIFRRNRIGKSISLRSRGTSWYVWNIRPISRIGECQTCLS